MIEGYINILFNGFNFDISRKDRNKNVGIKLEHFYPVTEWKWKVRTTESESSVDVNAEIEVPQDLIDMSTNETYCDDNLSTVRVKCAALFVATLVFQPIGLLLNIINKIIKVVSGAHFWTAAKSKYKFTARLGEWSKDLFVVVFTPVILLGMLLSSIYGTISPFNGRKLYATLERLTYSGGYRYCQHCNERELHLFLLAPCFQPNPVSHLFGGDIKAKNVW